MIQHRRFRILRLALLAALAVVAPLSAQQQNQAERVRVTGVIVDSASGKPLAGAHVTFSKREIVPTDAEGRFEVSRVPVGEQAFAVSALGYEPILVTVPVARDMEPVRVVLAANPVELAEIRVQVDRLQSRRRATATHVRVLSQADLAAGAGIDARLFIEQHAMLASLTCRPALSLVLSNSCVRSRGTTVQPVVIIDERPAFGGMEELISYSPQELYMVEIYGGGRQIRVYTNWFMQLAAHRHLNPQPIIL
jgi:hypothetical protein